MAAFLVAGACQAEDDEMPRYMKRAPTIWLLIPTTVWLLGWGVAGYAQAVSPPLPFEDPGACPFEGCVYREWRARVAVDVRSERRRDAPVVFRVQASETVTAVTGVVVTLVAGRIQFGSSEQFQSSQGPVHVRAGETLYLLTYQGEGFSKVWFRGKVHTDVDVSRYLGGACEPPARTCPGRVVAPARTDWWVQVRNKAGQVGWTREPDRFDGKDALG